MAAELLTPRAASEIGTIIWIQMILRNPPDTKKQLQYQI